ncbi:hypothetical protein NONI108955_36175 [Nocardia ninae]|uniref:Cell division protein FtsK n=1 Tax=Nocardia ninae NBRC 108245 TaxID=1210091 RepID=A0A511MM30_9NOCA|nr:hypothetical protein [Nocardia ninae]GEM41521.1 hypothetical protein NN4_60400 [Nocardia ninae NBRC 108245]
MAAKTIDTHKEPAEAVLEALVKLVWLTLKAAVVVLWWSVLFPMVSIPVVGALAAGLFIGWPWAVVVVGVSIAGMVLWRAKHPETFERWLTGRARARFLRWWRYRLRWDKRLESCKLTVRVDGSTFVPRLLMAEIGDCMDWVRVKMLPGQCPADYENRVERLAHTFEAPECRANIVGPGVVELVFRYTDSLADPVDLPRIDSRFRKDAA